MEGKAMVVGSLDRDNGVKTFVVNDTTKESLTNLIKENVESTVEIITDNFSSYRDLAKEGFNHIIVKKEIGSFVTDSYCHTNNMEGYWAILKRGIYGFYHQVSP